MSEVQELNKAMDSAAQQVDQEASVLRLSSQLEQENLEDVVSDSGSTAARRTSKLASGRVDKIVDKRAAPNVTMEIEDDQIDLQAEDDKDTFLEGNHEDEIDTSYLNQKKMPLDPHCDLQNVHVLEEYSCVLTSEDVSYNQLSSIRIMRMQLLERADKQKWTVWTAKGQGRHGVEEDLNEIENGLVEADAKQTKMMVHIYDHFNVANAKADFEKRF